MVVKLLERLLRSLQKVNELPENIVVTGQRREEERRNTGSRVTTAARHLVPICMASLVVLHSTLDLARLGK